MLSGHSTPWELLKSAIPPEVHLTSEARFLGGRSPTWHTAHRKPRQRSPRTQNQKNQSSCSFFWNSPQHGKLNRLSCEPHTHCLFLQSWQEAQVLLAGPCAVFLISSSSASSPRCYLQLLSRVSPEALSLSFIGWMKKTNGMPNQSVFNLIWSVSCLVSTKMQTNKMQAVFLTYYSWFDIKSEKS